MTLHPHHLQMLTEGSGIAADVIQERGCHTATTTAQLEALGFADYQRNTPALVLPVYDVHGNVALHQIRPDTPRKNKRGKTLKYDTPQHGKLVLDVLPRHRPSLSQADVPLMIVEGLKKADSVTSRMLPTTPLCVVGVIGTWGWMRNKHPLPDWRAIALKHREVTIVFDSDVADVPEVGQARQALATFLHQQGAEVRHVDLPPLPHGKCGVDDYFVQGHSLADLLALAQETFPRPQPVLTTLTDVEARPVEWLWWPYLAKGTIAMLDGDPGLGKSLLSLQLAACLSRGFPLPDQVGKVGLPTGKPQHVILITSEDSPEHTIKPRLLQADGDPAYVHILEGWKNPQADNPDELQAFTLKDIPMLEQALQQYPATLVIIDPLQAYLEGVDIHRSNETRPLMSKLATLARKYNVVMLCIRHPSKPGEGIGKALHRGLGSIDLIGIARTGLFVEAYPGDETRAFLAQTKNNLERKGRTLIFSKKDGLFAWDGVTRLTDDDLAGSGRGPNHRTFLEGFLWLEQRLEGGLAWPASDIEAEAEEQDISGNVLKRAKKALSVVSAQNKGDAHAGWTWRLPPLTLPAYTPTSSESSEPTESPESSESPDYKSMVYVDNSRGVEVGGTSEEGVRVETPLRTPEGSGVSEVSEDSVASEDSVDGVVVGERGVVGVTATVSLNGHAPPCFACRRTEYWLNDRGMRICTTCHPKPKGA